MKCSAYLFINTFFKLNTSKLSYWVIKDIFHFTKIFHQEALRCNIVKKGSPAKNVLLLFGLPETSLKSIFFAL